MTGGLLGIGKLIAWYRTPQHGQQPVNDDARDDHIEPVINDEHGDAIELNEVAVAIQAPLNNPLATHNEAFQQDNMAPSIFYEWFNWARNGFPS